jgi:hypothetical protein
LSDLAPSGIPADPFDWIAAQFETPGCRWSMGAFGASGAFPHGPALLEVGRDAIVAYSTGASIRFERKAKLQLVAFETISSDPFMWNHGVALCVPEDDLFAAPAGIIRDAGTDGGAIAPADRAARCFDIGIPSSQARVSIRPNDSEAVGILDRFVGETFWALPKATLEGLATSRLDLVIETPIGRLEMRQEADMPKEAEPYPPFIDIRLLKSGFTHARSTPVPSGLVACGYVFPPHPARQAPGVTKDFDRLEHVRCQAALDRFGVPVLVRLKREVEAALDSGAHPPSGVKTRHEIDVVRVALRQRLMIDPHIDLAPWLSVFDKPLLAAIAARGRTRQSS